MAAKKAVCIISGGMDSTLASVLTKNDGYEIVAVHFNYNQRTEAKELEAFRAITAKIGVVETYEIDLDFFKQIGASSLVDQEMEVPMDGVKPGVPNTYVPFRNGIFLSIASAIAEKEGAEALVIGVVEEDSSGYPDCRDSFINAFEMGVNLGTKDETNLTILRPLVDLSKAEIVAKSIEVGAPLELTWSCYQNSDKACGVCDSCRLRLNGFKKVNKKDPIEYNNVI